jgi:hypothetical protein
MGIQIFGVHQVKVSVISAIITPLKPSCKKSCRKHPLFLILSHHDQYGLYSVSQSAGHNSRTAGKKNLNMPHARWPSLTCTAYSWKS